MYKVGEIDKNRNRCNYDIKVTSAFNVQSFKTVYLQVNISVM